MLPTGFYRGTGPGYSARMRPSPLTWLSLAALLCAPLCPAAAFAAGPVASVLSVDGDVKGRPPRSEAYGRLAKGDRLPYGSRLRTGDRGQATLRFEDGTEVKVRAKSEVLVRPRPTKQASGVVLFFGRVWSKVVKSVGGQTSFEVESANAVAGVRGTEFEVGVADDGSTRVIVGEGVVAVEGDSVAKAVPISAGFAVESDSQGRLDKRRKAPARAKWDQWFAKRARILEKRGLKVARHLEGRLDKRKAKVQRLVEKQRDLRKEIEALERQRQAGADVEQQLQSKLQELQKVTARLEDMKDRLQAAFGMFERWGAVAEKGSMQGAEQVSALVADVSRAAREFADMIEEGTDLSEDGMNDMMDEMGKGGSLKGR